MELDNNETPKKNYIKRNRIDSDDEDEGQNNVEECTPMKRPTPLKKEKISDDDDEEYYTGNSQSSESEEETDGDNHYLDKINDFTEEQKEAFDYVIKLVNGDKKFKRENPNAIFIDGPVGAGKTELLTTLCDYTDKKLDQSVMYVASVGSAAQKYHKGRTCYSVFGFPYDEKEFEKEFCDMSDYNKQVTGSSLIVFDEVQMTHGKLLEMLDRTLRNIMMSDKIFGGKTIVFAGDFRQIPPVVKIKKGACQREDTNMALFKISELWPELKKFTLTIPQRTKFDPEFTKYLFDLGNDILEPKIISDSKPEFVPLNDIEYTFKLDDLIDFVYPRHILNDADKCARRSIIAPHKETVNKINSKLLERLEGKMKTFEALQDMKQQSKEEKILLEQNMLLEDKNFPDFTLKLKKGCVCTIIRTMYKPTTLLVGTRVIVTKIFPEAIIIRKVGEKQIYTIGMEYFEKYHKKTSVKEKFYQFPVKLGYASTIHTCQGMTFDRVGIDLSEHAFVHGQLYTALGRVRSKKDVKVLIKEEHMIDNIAHTANVNNFELLE